MNSIVVARQVPSARCQVPSARKLQPPFIRPSYIVRRTSLRISEIGSRQSDINSLLVVRCSLSVTTVPRLLRDNPRS